MEFEQMMPVQEAPREDRAEMYANQYDKLCRKIEDNPELLNDAEVGRQMEKLISIMEHLGMDPVEEEPTLH